MAANLHDIATSGEVVIQGATIHYQGPNGPVQVLSATDLTLSSGSFTALIGPSGCGKSTLLNAIAGFVRPSGGTIRVDGRPVTGPSPEVGVVFQQYALFPWFTARGNIEFALKRFGLSRAERREAALEALAEVGLHGRAETYPGQLSGGMKQRVALARTLASKPKVLLMDEPFGALDAQTRVSMHELLLRVMDAHRSTVLFVTHDVDEGLVLADRAHVMSATPGRIIDTLELGERRNRSVDKVDTAYIANRNRIMGLLRHREDEPAAALPRRATA
ncbi:sulfonate ABC transporter ATP-binding lipoprotein [Skermanella stibiiresistens SB22]|uniref:Sulfonate ABC transporter ATP-binding lipoprotein n=1 Tax=Skermanella stibiiresistens SB22 TaxID=1385369 RepID=W9H6Y1_9PROT|nr:ABC transporter ATP-binding protein [Skermanella stibiiresistens]EWY41789.1 sulfonate ABC transporter ATP-binding lipoprotein [Skermanella stibiiresistens SB22]